MKNFTHINAGSIDEACELLAKYNGKAMLNAGGTDLLTVLKGDLLADYPKALINIKTIDGLNYINETNGALQIGAMTTLTDIADAPLIRKNYRVLSEAARSVASPQIRNFATIGGNLCQDTRCWYYRYPRNLGGPIVCARKGRGHCLAVKGDNRYHAVMGGKKCFAVCPSDTAIALAALDADVVIAGADGIRRTPVMAFYHPLGTTLRPGEMVTKIEMPAVSKPAAQRFVKFTLRKPIDFAIVSVAVALVIQEKICKDARIILGAVAPGPVREKEAEAAVIGRTIDNDIAQAAAQKVLSNAKPLKMNAYKIEIGKALVKRALLEVEFK